MNKIQQLLKHEEFKIFQKFSGVELVSFVFLYFTSFLLNAYFTEQQLGEFSYLYNLILLIYPLFSLNFFESYLLYSTKKEINQYLYIHKVIKVSIVGTIILFATLYFWSNSILISSAAFIITYNERTYYFRSIIKTKIYGTLKSLNSILIFILVLLLIYFNKLTFENVIGSYGFAYLISSLLGYGISIKYRIIDVRNGNNVSFLQISKYSVPIVGSAIITWVLTFSDQYFIEYYYSYEDLAKYSIGNRALNVIRIFTGFFLVYWPTLYFKEMATKNYRKIKRIRNLFIGLILCLSLTLIFSSKFIYLVLGARKYIPFVKFFNLLVIAEFFRIIGGLYLTIKSYQSKTYINMLLVGIVGVFNLILNYMFIETLGVEFAAISTLLSMSLFFIIAYFSGKRTERIAFLN